MSLNFNQNAKPAIHCGWTWVDRRRDDINAHTPNPNSLHFSIICPNFDFIIDSKYSQCLLALHCQRKFHAIFQDSVFIFRILFHSSPSAHPHSVKSWNNLFRVNLSPSLSLAVYILSPHDLYNIFPFRVFRLMHSLLNYLTFSLKRTLRTSSSCYLHPRPTYGRIYKAKYVQELDQKNICVYLHRKHSPAIHHEPEPCSGALIFAVDWGSHCFCVRRFYFHLV